MNEAQDDPQERHRAFDRTDGELQQARELLERTTRFLALCADDPEEALRSQDPRELIRDLELLARERYSRAPEPADEHREPRTIPIHRRRSA